MQSSTRGQSSSVGAILLVGVVTLSMGTYGAVYLGQIDDETGTPVVEVSGEVTTEGVTLTHEAGDASDESDLRVTLSVEGTEWTNVTWANGSVEGTPDGRFSPGETWTWDDGNFTSGDRVEVVLVDESAEIVAYRGTHVVRAAGGGVDEGGGATDAPPTASVSYAPSSPLTNEAVAFDASASDDPDGGSLTYQWTFGDGATDSGETPTHSYDEDGPYDVTLTVTDDEGDTASTTRTVSVSNRPPNAEFSHSPSSPEAGAQVDFDAIVSDDPDGSIASHDWAFGDGTTGSGERVNHTYASTGDYAVTLTVEDDDGATATTTKVVTVTEGADTTAPSVTVGRPNGDETIRGGTTYAVEWAASDDSGVDSVKLEYSTDDGNSWSTIDSGLANDGSYEWSVPSLDTAEALVRVTATDAAGNAASDESDRAFAIDGLRPDIDTFGVTTTDANPSGKNGRVTVDWGVSDEIGLSSLTIRLERADGTEVETATPTVGGDTSASGAAFSGLKVDSGDYRVIITVTDAAGREREQSRDVTVEKRSGGPGGGGKGKNK